MAPKLSEAIESICAMDAEVEAITVLLKIYAQKQEKQQEALRDRENSLRAICKWNREKYRDEAIDILSDVDNYDVED